LGGKNGVAQIDEKSRSKRSTEPGPSRAALPWLAELGLAAGGRLIRTFCSFDSFLIECGSASDRDPTADFVETIDTRE
jgi:hypothetical protein